MIHKKKNNNNNQGIFLELLVAAKNPAQWVKWVYTQANPVGEGFYLLARRLLWGAQKIVQSQAPNKIFYAPPLSSSRISRRVLASAFRTPSTSALLRLLFTASVLVAGTEWRPFITQTWRRATSSAAPHTQETWVTWPGRYVDGTHAGSSVPGGLPQLADLPPLLIDLDPFPSLPSLSSCWDRNCEGANELTQFEMVD